MDTSIQNLWPCASDGHRGAGFDGCGHWCDAHDISFDSDNAEPLEEKKPVSCPVTKCQEGAPLVSASIWGTVRAFNIAIVLD